MSFQNDIDNLINYEGVNPNIPPNIRLLAYLHKQAENSSTPNELAALTWGAIIDDSISTIAEDILPADPNRKAILICNHSPSGKIKINIAADASATSAIAFIQAESTITLSGGVEGRISAIATSGTINYTVRVAT